MKVNIVKVHEVWPQSRQSHPQSALLPVLDAWYAYRRTVPTLYLFQSPTRPTDLAAELVESLSRALNIFPRFTGILESVTLPCKENEKQEVQRTVVKWGYLSDRAVEFTEAHTKARIQPLLPPTTLNVSSFLWDYTQASLHALFPKTSATTPGLRVQLTTFGCGGFSLGIDFEHGLADGHTAGQFLRHWSTIIDQLFYGKTTVTQNIPSWQPNILSDQVANINAQEDGPKLLEKARTLPTRRPDLRTLPGHDSPTVPSNASTTMNHYFLHIPAAEIERKLQEFRAKAPIRLTDQAALIGFFWASFNRARGHATQPLDLHLASSFRWLLGAGDGLLGSPIAAVMISPEAEGDAGHATDPIKLAVRITETLDRYDDDAMQAIIYDANFRDSPSSSFRPQVAAEHLEFSSVVHLGYDKFNLGALKPAFCVPSSSIPNLFVLAEALPSDRAVGNAWYRNGLNLFFNVTEDGFEGLTSDPEFVGCETYTDF